MNERANVAVKISLKVVDFGKRKPAALPVQGGAHQFFDGPSSELRVDVLPAQPRDCDCYTSIAIERTGIMDWNNLQNQVANLSLYGKLEQTLTLSAWY